MREWLRFGRKSKGRSRASDAGNRSTGGRPQNSRYRSARLESLESRQLLAVSSVAVFGNIDALIAGSPGWVGIDGVASPGERLTYTVSVDSTNLSGGAISYDLMSGADNRSLKIDLKTADNTIHGSLLLQLFENDTPDTVARITELAESGKYNGSTFHRMIQDFMIQGGIVSGTVNSFDDEFYMDNQFTSAGLLAMANSGIDTNSSQFFITTAATRWLDYNHTIFGMLTEGVDILSLLNEDVSPTTAESAGGTPKQTVTMTNVSVINNVQDAVLKLNATPGTTGTAVVTVTATDESGGTYQKSFTVTVGPDADGTSANPKAAPAFGPIGEISVTPGGTVSGTLPVFNVDNQTLTYYVDAADGASKDALTVTFDTVTQRYTITAKADAAYGVYEVVAQVRVSGSSTEDDSQRIAILVAPTAPTVILSTESGSSGQTSLNNADADSALKFNLTKLVPGATVNIYADNVKIATATVPTDATTMTITTDGKTKLSNAIYAIRAEQILPVTGGSVKIGNNSYSSLPSARSTAYSLAVQSGNGKPTITVPSKAISITARETDSDPATTFTVTVDDGNPGVEQTLTATVTQQPAHGTLTVVDATTGRFSYTPEIGYTGADSFTFTLTNTAYGGEEAQTSDPVTIQLSVNGEDPEPDPETVTKPKAISVVSSMLSSKKQVVIQLSGSVTGQPTNMTYRITYLPPELSIASFDTKTGRLVCNLNWACSKISDIQYVTINNGETASIRSDKALASVRIVKSSRDMIPPGTPAESLQPPAESSPAPTAGDVSVSVEPGEIILVTLEGKAASGRVISSYQITQQPTEGTLTPIDEASGIYMYAAFSTASGIDTIRYKAVDDLGQPSTEALVTVTVTIS